MNLYVDRDPLIRSFRGGLVDETISTIIQSSFREGMPLFAELSTRKRFAPQSSETLLRAFVKNDDRRVRLAPELTEGVAANLVSIRPAEHDITYPSTEPFHISRLKQRLGRAVL